MPLEVIETIGCDSNYSDNSGYRWDRNYRDNSDYRENSDIGIYRGICFYMGYNEKSPLRVGVAILFYLCC